MGTPSINNNEINPTSGITNKPAVEESIVKTDKPKLIFSGMTRTQAEAEGVLDMFVLANTDGDDKISEKEFALFKNPVSNSSTSLFQPQEKELTGHNKISGLEKVDAYNQYRAVINYIMKTEGISEAEAKKRISQANISQGMEKMSQTLKALNYDASKVDWDNVRTLNADELKEATGIITLVIPVHGGMTRAEAERKGGETLKMFNAICKDGQDSITEADILCYKQAKLEEKGIKIENIIKTYNSADKVTQMKIISGLIGSVADKDNIREEFKGLNSVDDFVKTLGIEESWNKATTPEEKGKLLGSSLLEIIKKDINFDDMNSRIYKEISDIAAGNFNKDELARGYAKGDELSSNEIKQLAIGRITKEYLSTITHLCETAFEGVDEKEKAAVVHSLFDSLEQSPMVRQLLQAWGINSMTEGSEEQTNAVKAIAKYETEHKDLDASSVTGSMIVSSIIRYGDEETINDFIVNNSDQVDAINNVANDTVNSMPDGEKKSNLRMTIDNAVNVAKIYNATTPEALSDRSEQAGINVSEAPVTNPIYDNNGNDINTLKMLSQDFEVNSQKTPQQIKQEKFMAEIERQHQELRSKMRVKIAEIKNKPPQVALAMMCSHFDQMPDRVKAFFLNGLTRMKNSHHDMLCEAYLRGDENLRQFLNHQHIISNNDIFVHLDSHPGDIKYANKTIEANYYASRSELLYQNKVNESNTKLKSHWHDLT